jgi:hypothetical protein
MIGDRQRIRIDGFEEALVEFIGDNFRFSDIGLRSIPLEGGRHFFVGQLPTVKAIGVTVAEARKLDPTVFPYEPSKEPSIMLDKQSNTGFLPSSSIGSRHVWLTQFLLRLGKVPELTTKLLEELYEWMVENVKGSKVGTFQIKGAEPVQRPTTFAVAEDDHVVIAAVIRFRGVPLPF